MTHPQVRPDPAFGLLELYDDALPHVYGYLLARCGDTGLAEDLTAESFLAAVHALTLRYLDGRPARATRLRQGDVANVTMVARDTHRAKEFYQAVLGVPFASGHPGAWRTDQTSPPLSILPSRGAEPEVQLSYRVDDLAAAIERARAAGGHAGEPARMPYGLLATCVDDQGTTFRLWQPTD